MKVVNVSIILIVLLCFISCKTIISNNEKLGLIPNVVFFTYDDAPNIHGETTEKLLDVLNKYDIKGIFCLLGVNVLKYPEIVRRIHDEGHIIVNHGFSDKFSVFMNDDDFRENLFLAELAINEVLGFELYPRYYRPQGGFYNRRQENILKEEGYTIIYFTISIMDVLTTSSGKDRLSRRKINAVIRQNGGILLFHDGRGGHERREKRLRRSPRGSFNRSWVPEVTEEIIIALLERGFILDGKWLNQN